MLRLGPRIEPRAVLRGVDGDLRALLLHLPARREGGDAGGDAGDGRDGRVSAGIEGSPRRARRRERGRETHWNFASAFSRAVPPLRFDIARAGSDGRGEPPVVGRARRGVGEAPPDLSGVRAECCSRRPVAELLRSMTTICAPAAHRTALKLDVGGCKSHLVRHSRRAPGGRPAVGRRHDTLGARYRRLRQLRVHGASRPPLAFASPPLPTTARP